MQSEKLFLSDLKFNAELFRRSQLLLPLYPSHSQAKKQLVTQIKRDEAWQLTTDQQTLFVAFTTQDKAVVLTNLLAEPSSTFSWETGLKMLENFFRQHFFASLTVPLDLGLPMKMWLLEHGYQESNQGMKKQFTYNTALVLGGGGARGAYQIGVWEALRQTKIEFKWITGTSVGALNGALILMDDLKVAQELWWTISTDKILAFPEASLSSQSFANLLQQMSSLATTALKENGASTKPLQALLEKIFDAEKMQRHPGQLLVCTTRLLGLQEVIHPFDPAKGVSELDWLTASASFYPGMMPMEIDGELYVDGGYRNNLPLDVALEKGATECICIDVKGPGIVKKTAVPLDVARIDLDTLWPLGNLLVFDRERSENNYRLGYLETMKYLGFYSGKWYTFTTGTPWKKSWRDFIASLKTEPETLSLLAQPEFWTRVSKVYRQKAPPEEAGQIFIEVVARLLEVAPTEIYDEAAFLTAVKKGYQEGKGSVIGSLSISEWLRQYQNEYFVLSEKNQLIWCCQQLQTGGKLPAFLSLAPVMAVTAKFLSFILNNQMKRGMNDGE